MEVTIPRVSRQLSHITEGGVIGVGTKVEAPSVANDLISEPDKARL